MHRQGVLLQYHRERRSLIEAVRDGEDNLLVSLDGMGKGDTHSSQKSALVGATRGVGVSSG